MYNSGEDIGAIVADIGTFATRVGYAGEDMPKAYFPTLIGVNNPVSPQKRDFHFDLSNFRQNIAIESPLRDGVIHDWEMFEKLWEYSLRNVVKTEAAETPVLMAEKSYNTSSIRQKTCEIMFEKYKVPSFFIAKDAVLSCFALGRTTGLTVDIGTNGTVITPVLDGWADTRNIKRSMIGGRYLDAYVLSVLKTKGIEPLPLFRLIKTVTQDKRILVSQNPNIVSVHPSYDALMKLDIGRDLKESTCRMAESTLMEADPRYINIPQVPYELPDGTIVDLGIERFQVPEILCDPTPENLYVNDLALLGLGQLPAVLGYQPVLDTPISRLACDSVLKCDPENYAGLLSGLTITGGSSKFEGCPERLKCEIERTIHLTIPGAKVRSISAGPSERALCTWLGGSILASLGSFHDMWMTKHDYGEYGATIVDKKCP